MSGTMDLNVTGRSKILYYFAFTAERKASFRDRRSFSRRIWIVRPAEASISAATSCCFISDSSACRNRCFTDSSVTFCRVANRSLSASRDVVAMLVNDANAGDASVRAAAAAAAAPPQQG